MFNVETIQNFLRRDSTEEDVKAIEQAKEFLKKYECFSKLLNGKENLFQECKDIILKDLFLIIRGNPNVNRDYIIGYQDAVEVFLRNLSKYKEVMEQINK